MAENRQHNSQIEEERNLISLQELCSILSISAATGRNWLRLGKITPQYKRHQDTFCKVDSAAVAENSAPNHISSHHVYFTEEYVRQLTKDMESGRNPALKSRRNKKYLSGNSIYRSYVEASSPNLEVIQNLIENTLGKVSTGDNQTQTPYASQSSPLYGEALRFLLAECALQLFSQRLPFIPQAQAETRHSHENAAPDSKAFMLAKYMEGKYVPGIYAALIDDLIGDKSSAARFICTHTTIFSYSYHYIPYEDTLGLLYLSIQNIADRKTAGSYYTPTAVVQHAISRLCGQDSDFSCKKVLDPCCGTGNFLLQLTPKFSMENIYGNDIDTISVQLARINLALSCLPGQTDILYRNITCSDYLCDYVRSGFDYILGNPPWGYAFTETEKIRLGKNYRSANGRYTESCDLFLEQALHHLKKGGTLSYVLPEAVLNVKAHASVREIILQDNSISYLEYLGNIFDNVQCPCIILQLEHTGEPLSCVGMEITEGKRSYKLSQNRTVTSACFCFRTTDPEQAVLDKLTGHPDYITLKNQADFALGIVTGNNSFYLSRTKDEGTEPVCKGSSILKFRMKTPENFIAYTPGLFQQTAPVNYYRAPEKLFYRFICQQLVFAYDDRQTLSLNSCNILIPHVPGLSIKYIMAVLNSRTAQFIFQKQFHSMKVLRSHIEQIPIPVATFPEQIMVETIADAITNSDSPDDILKFYNELDKKIARLYELNQKEYQMILETSHGVNLFL